MTRKKKHGPDHFEWRPTKPYKRVMNMQKPDKERFDVLRRENAALVKKIVVLKAQLKAAGVNDE